MRIRNHNHTSEFAVFPTQSLADEWDREGRTCSRKEAAGQFRHLLEAAESEQDIQDYLEEHPRVLPDLGFYHNGPRGDLVVSKLPLGHDFVTDFAFVSENSQMVQFTCIEIESPRKRLFNRGADFTRDYLNAKQQIIDWNGWAQQNLREAMRMFGRLANWLPEKYYTIGLNCILVYGRRAEINTTKRKQRWAAEGALSPHSFSMMTFDRLLEKMESGWNSWDKKMLVCKYVDRALHVKRVCH